MAIALLLRLMLIELRGGRDDLHAGVDLRAAVDLHTVVLLVETRLQLVQRDELLRLRVKELRVALCHFLRDHLLFRGSAEAQEIVQLRLELRRSLLWQLAMMKTMMMLGVVVVLMIMEDTVVHANAIARGDYRVILDDDGAAAAVR